VAEKIALEGSPVADPVVENEYEELAAEIDALGADTSGTPAEPVFGQPLPLSDGTWEGVDAYATSDEIDKYDDTVPPAADDPEGQRRHAEARIKALSYMLFGEPGSERATWISIGHELLRARDSFAPSTKKFGAWVKATGIDQLPGLLAPASRSDAIWCAEHPDREALVPQTVQNPRQIRIAWRKLFQAAVLDAAAEVPEWFEAPESGELSDLTASEKACLDASAEKVDEATASGLPAAVAAIFAQLVMQPSDAAAAQASKAKAEAALSKALDAAMAAGVGHDTVAMLATVSYGGHFAWTPKPQETMPADPADAFAKVIHALIEKGKKMKEINAVFADALGEAFDV